MPAHKVPPFVLVSGDEPLLIDRAIGRTLAAVRKAEPDVERRERPVTGLTPGEFADMVAPSLFAEPRVVVLRGAQESAKELAGTVIDYLDDPAEGVVLIVHHTGAARNKPLADALRRHDAAVFTCNRIKKPAELADFVRSEITRAGGTCTSVAAVALVDAVGSDLAELAMATGQLVADTGGLIDETAVARYYRGKADVSGFTIADKAVAGDLAGALESLRWAEDIGVAPVLIADALADGVRTLAKVAGARGGNSYSLAGELGMPPWKIDKARGVVRHWNPAGLARGMAVVAELNADVKGAAADVDYAVERAVIAVVRARALR